MDGGKWMPRAPAHPHSCTPFFVSSHGGWASAAPAWPLKGICGAMRSSTCPAHHPVRHHDAAPHPTPPPTPCKDQQLVRGFGVQPLHPVCHPFAARGVCVCGVRSQGAVRGGRTTSRRRGNHACTLIAWCWRACPTSRTQAHQRHRTCTAGGTGGSGPQTPPPWGPEAQQGRGLTGVRMCQAVRRAFTD